MCISLHLNIDVIALVFVPRRRNGTESSTLVNPITMSDNSEYDDVVEQCTVRDVGRRRHLLGNEQAAGVRKIVSHYNYLADISFTTALPYGFDSHI